MPFEPDVLASKSTNVDHLEEIRLPGLDWHGQVLRVVEKHGLGNRFGAPWVRAVDELRKPHLHLLMVPIRDREREALVIFVRKVRIRDDERCSKTVWVLPLVVGVVPVGARLRDLHAVSQLSSLSWYAYIEIVSELRTWRDWTLRNLGRAVHVRGPVHVEAVEVKGGGLVAELVIDIDNDAIALRRCHDWQGPLAVDANGWPLEKPIWVRPDPGDVKVVGDGRCFCEGQ